MIKGTTTYKYYANGYLERLIEYQSGKKVYEETHKYEDSNYVRISQYYSDSEIRNRKEISYFDTSRKLIKQENYNTLDKIESHKEFSYDQGTEQNKTITLSYSFNTLIETLTEKLNSNKQIILSEYKFKNNSLNYTQTNEYDKFCNIILFKIEYPKYSNENRIESFKYEYDSQGNWVKRIHLSNNKITNIIIHKIEYY